MEERQLPCLQKRLVDRRVAAHRMHLVTDVLGPLIGMEQHPGPWFFQLLPDFQQLLHGKAYQLFCSHPWHQSRMLGSRDHHEFQFILLGFTLSVAIHMPCSSSRLNFSQLTWAQHSAARAAYSSNCLTSSHNCIRSNPYNKPSLSPSSVLLL